MQTYKIIWLVLGLLLLQQRWAHGEQRVEINSWRDYHSKTFLNADGSYTMEISAGYVHYRDERGEFQEIDPHFVPAQDPRYLYEVKRGLYAVCLEKVAADELVFSYQPAGGDVIRFRLRGIVFYHASTGRQIILNRVRRVMPVVHGNILRLENIFPGVTLQYIYGPLKLKEEIIFSQSARNSLPLPASLGLGNQNIYVGFLTQVEMDSAMKVSVNGQPIRFPQSPPASRIIWNHHGSQLVHFHTSAGKPQFYFPEDFAVSAIFQDSAFCAYHSQLITRKFYSSSEGDFMISMVPLNWLKSQPAGSVVFDPQLVVSSPTNDTWIESNSASSFHTYTNIRVGRGSSYNWKRSLLKFNFSPSSLPDNARIISAQCRLYWYSSWKASNGIYVARPIFLHQVLKDWNESQVDWYEAKTGVNWSSNGVGFNDLDARRVSEDMLVWGVSGYPRWMEYNVTQLVQRWYEGSSPNYGIILWAANENDYTNADEKWIYSSNYSDPSKHPRLVINYTLNDLVEYTYTPSGTIDSVYLGRDIIRGNYDYTIRDWINHIDFRDLDNHQPFKVDFLYDLTGNILHQQYTNLSESDQISHTYDAIYQLKTAMSNIHSDQEFSYDANGNILSKKVDATTSTYIYDLDRPNRLRQVGSRNFAYDRNGNIISDGSLNLAYDHKNQLMDVSGLATESYSYDSDGRRVKKSESVSTSGTGFNVSEWNLQVTTAIDGVVPTGGTSMYRIQVNTTAGSGDHYTNEKIVIADGLQLVVTAGSYLEYDIRAAQSSAMRASVQFYYFDPASAQYYYSWDLTYQDQNGLSNNWKTDLNSRYVNQWYHRVLPLTSLQGKIIKKVFFMTNDDPNTTGPQSYTFYCDEIRIDGQDLGRANGNAAAPTVFYETFDDGNLHDGMPVDWYTTGSYWTISAGNLFWSNWSSASSGQCSHPTLVVDDFDAQFDLKADGRFADNYWTGFAFRKNNYNDWYNTSGYMVYYRYNGEVCLYKAGGNLVSVQTGKSLANWHVVKIRALKSSIKVWVDDYLYIDWSDEGYGSGYVGLNVYGVGARYDNLKISGIPVENEVYYVRDGEGNVIAEYDGLGNLLAEYVYGNSQRIAKIKPDKTIEYYLNDHLGSARTMSSSGWSANYYPFGEMASQTGSPEDTRFDFTGQERDRGTGLLYFGARYYDPGISRWLSVDPLFTNYSRWSPYNYSLNNPITYKDHDGRWVWGAVIGGGLDIAAQYAISVNQGQNNLSVSGFLSFIKKPVSEGGLNICQTLTSAGMGLIGSGVSQSVGKIITASTVKGFTTRAAINGISNASVGAVAEYITTGEVTEEKVITNGVLGATGSIVGDAVQMLGTSIVIDEVIVLGGENTPANAAPGLLEGLPPPTHVVNPLVQGIANATSNTISNLSIVTQNEDDKRNENKKR